MKEKFIRRFPNILEENFMLVTFFVSTTSMLGSLYYSEIEKLDPCSLCWYQRIFMYPLVFISAVAYLRKDYKAYFYVLPLSLIGILIAAYHYYIEQTSSDSIIGNCSASVPCNEVVLSYLGFITIPFMSFMAFLTINIVTLGYVFLKNRHGK